MGSAACLRRGRGGFDAEAFQRAFDKFMDERGWEARESWSHREGRGQRERDRFDRFWDDFHRECGPHPARQDAGPGVAATLCRAKVAHGVRDAACPISTG